MYAIVNDADSAASTRSPETPSENPAPAATPLTAVISTASIRAKVDMARCRSLAMPLTKTPGSSAAAIALRSPPAQKNRPAPVSVTTFVSALSHSAAASARSRVMAAFMPLAASGRSSTMLTTDPARVNFSVSKAVMAITVLRRGAEV